MLNYSNELQAKNIFLSGKRNSGKTTIIKKLAAELNLSVSGFMVGRDIDREEWTSFYLLPALVFLENNKKKIKVWKDKATFAWKDKKGNIKFNYKIFENHGINLLTNYSKKDIIIMDELGHFELKAKKFQKKVLDIIKSDNLVLGVIKSTENHFLNTVRNNLKQNPIIVTKYNREVIYNLVLKKLKNWRSKND